MTSADRRLVLVTGTPRSGTTPVGDLLAAAPGTRALYEPLNFHVGDRRVSRYFETLGSGEFTAERCDELVAAIRDLRLRLRPGLFPEDRGARRLVKRATGSQTRWTYRRCRLRRGLRTVVWKDPFAMFLAPRVAAVHGVPVVVTLRPPEAVAASFKRLGWRFDVADLVDRLGPAGDRYRPVLAGVRLGRPVDDAAALWHVANDWLLRTAASAPGIQFLDLDRLVTDRVPVMRGLFDRLALPWTPAVERQVAQSAAVSGAAVPTGHRAHGGRRDPAAVNSYWTGVLTETEARSVTRLNGDLWQELRPLSL